VFDALPLDAVGLAVAAPAVPGASLVAAGIPGAVPRVALSSHVLGFPVGLVVVAVAGVALVPVFVLVERVLGDEDDREGVPLGSVPVVETDEEDGTATLPDGTTLDAGEAAAVAAVYDYFERRPAAPREEITAACFDDHPAGFEDPAEWWDRLVQPAVTCIAEAGVEASAGSGGTDGGRLRETPPGRPGDET